MEPFVRRFIKSSLIWLCVELLLKEMQEGKAAADLLGGSKAMGGCCLWRRPRHGCGALQDRARPPKTEQPCR